MNHKIGWVLIKENTVFLQTVHYATIVDVNYLTILQ